MLSTEKKKKRQFMDVCDTDSCVRCGLVFLLPFSKRIPSIHTGINEFSDLCSACWYVHLFL